MIMALSGIMTSCSENEELSVKEVFSVKNSSLSLVPQIAHSEAITRATEDGKVFLNENTLNAVDVFVSEQGQNTFIYQKHLPTTSGGTVNRDVENLLENDWKKAGLEAAKKYTVYLSANSDDVVANGTINSVTDLLAKQVSDVDVYRHYDTQKQNDATSQTKTFVMSGKKENWQVDATKDSQTFEVELKRASAKVEVNVSFAPEFLKALAEGTTDRGDYKNMKGEILTTPAWRYVNFGKNTTVFSDNEGNVSTEKITRPNMMFSTLELDANKKFQIVTYSYPIAWEKEKAVDEAPFIMISIGYKLWDKTNDNPTEKDITTTYNYYRIPICNELEIDKLERNNIYRVNATIGSFGSASMDGDNAILLNYEVLPWTVDAADAANLMGKELGFLNVTPNEYTIYGNGTIPVKLKVFKPANGTIEISTPKIYYINASNAERVKNNQTAATYFPDDVTTVSTLKLDENSATRGTITVESKDLANHAVKYIEFTVKMTMKDTYLEQAVRIKHIPLDNIQNFPGAWSSKTDPGWVNWDTDQGKSDIYDYIEYYSGGGFAAKVYYNNRVYNIDYDYDYDYDYWTGRYIISITSGIRRATSQSTTFAFYSASDNRYVTKGIDGSALDNNHMYVIQIASTSNEYILGKPTLDGNYQSKDQVVSPAFMIASQLGAVSTFGREGALDAALHCGTYLEVGTNKHRYTGWRLPTAQEIGIISKYQTMKPQGEVMAPVLTGQYYHTLSGTRAPSNYSTDGNTAVRCIRDLTLNDLKYLNGEMTAADRTRYENNEIQ